MFFSFLLFILRISATVHCKIAANDALLNSIPTCVWSVGPKRTVNPTFNCALEIDILTYLLTYLLTYVQGRSEEIHLGVNNGERRTRCTSSLDFGV